ncbi:MAG: hypothetical protein PWP06_1593, partial [Candidatus Marinimicrobia bacterium]|nr:hypothetical protein [Candidatus Neomarinimicrobiota bacterium]
NAERSEAIERHEVPLESYNTACSEVPIPQSNQSNQSSNQINRLSTADYLTIPSASPRILREDKILIIFSGKLAERQGFEPWLQVTPQNGLAIRRLKPLGHLSLDCRSNSRKI